MNLIMIRPKTETEDLLLSLTENCQTLSEQTHKKPEETMDYRLTKLRKTFHFSPPSQIEADWMVGLTSLEVYTSIFNITARNNKLEQYRDTSNKFGFLKLKDELREILNIPHISSEHLQDEMIGPRIIDKFIKLSNEKKDSDGYMIFLLGYSKSQFRDFEFRWRR